MGSESKNNLQLESFGFARAINADAGGLPRNGIDDDIAEMGEWIQSMAADCDQRMSDVTEEDIACALGGGGEGGSGISAHCRAGFAGLDRKILAILNTSGGNHSTKNDTWSRRRFDEWRLQNGMPTSVPIESMHLQALADVLPTFFRQVMKHSGEHYPPESLLGFYRGFTLIMQKAQEARSWETRVIETPFCMKSQSLFWETGIAFLEAMRRSVLAGANKPRKKPVSISWSDEQAMLADRDQQPSHPYGCFRRWAYYCVSRFGLRSGKELYNVMDFDFQEQKDETGNCIVYGERLLKNDESSAVTPAVIATPAKAIRRTKVEQLRVSVKCHQEDVIHTYRQFMKHQPVKVGDEVGKPRRLFLQPIGNPVTNAWFAKSHVSERVLISMFRTMAVVDGVHVKDITNKLARLSPVSMRTVGVSTMIPTMNSVTMGSGSNGLCKRYGAKLGVQVSEAQSSIANILDSRGSKRNFQEAFTSIDNTEQNSFGDLSSKSVQLLGSGPHHVKAAAGGLPKSDQQPLAYLDTSSLHQDVLAKLQIAQRQFKDLELTLFGKITLPGPSLCDLVQVAMSQLKGLESTLSSMITIS